MSSSYTLRPARPEDQKRISALVRSAKLNPLKLDWQRFLVAEADGGQVVACGQIRLHRGGIRELSSLVVAQDWRGQGLARAIIERLMTVSGRPLWLMCRSRLVPLYHRFGFEEVAPVADQPAYFRRVRRLANVYHLLARTEEHLAVMVCWAGESPQSAGARS